MQIQIPELARRLKPYFVDYIGQYQLAQTDVVAEDHGALTGLSDDDHLQYIHVSNPRTITVRHTFNPTVAGAPFTLGANAIGQVVTGLRADELNKSISVSGLGLSGGGLLTADRTITLTSSSNPGQTASIIATDGLGHFTIYGAYFTSFVDIGTSGAYLSVNSTRVVVNDLAGAVVDFIVKGDTDQALLRCDASADKVGIGVAAPDRKLEVLDASGPQLRLTHTDATKYADFQTDTNSLLTVTSVGGITLIATGDINLSPSGSVIVNEDGNAATDVRMEGDNFTHMFFLDASLNRIGINQSAPDVTFEILNTATQFRLTYTDNTYYADFTVGGGGNLTIAPSGDLILDPTGNDVLPNINYDINLGGPTNKFLTIWAAELWVETLVAAEVRSTIGGRVVVAPTTELILDLGSSDTTIDVKHNMLSTGDRIWMEGGGKFEFMAVTSEYTEITGGYRYSVTRDLDGTGANSWLAGDAVVNTGTIGSGFIDLYALESFKGRSPDYIYNYNNTGAVFSPNHAGSTNWQPFGDGASTEANDALYIGNKGTSFLSVYFWISTAAVHTTTILCQYWNGALWSTIIPTVELDGGAQSVDNLFEGVGTWRVSFSAPAGWVTNSVNGQTAYWLRFRISSFTSWTTTPWSRGKHTHIGKAQWGPTIVGWRRNSDTFNDVTEHWAIGNLNGLYDYGLDVMGAAFGAAGTLFTAVDDTNGFRIVDGVTVIGQWSTAGIITVGDVQTEHIRISPTSVQIKDNTNVYTDLTAGALTLGLTSQEHVIISSTVGFQIKDNTVVRGNWQTDGDIFIGINLANAADTYFSIFANAQTYNSESVSAGDLLIGDNSASKANIFWDKSVGRLLFRGGTTSQAYIDTDGAISCGGSPWQVRLDATGLTLREGINNANKIKFMSSSDVVRGYMYASTLGLIYLRAEHATTPSIVLDAAVSGTPANLYLDPSAGSAGIAFGNSQIVLSTALFQVFSDGMAIDQDTADGLILEFKSSDVTHGMTNYYNQNTYGAFRKLDPNGGGLAIFGVSELAYGIYMQGYATSGNTGKSTTAEAPIMATSVKKDPGSGGIVDMGTNENIFLARNGSNAKFIIDAEGDIHVDAGGSYGNSVISGSTILGYNTYDEFDDVQLVRALDVERNGAGLLRSEFDKWLKYNRDDLQKLKLATFNDYEGGDGSIFVNYSGLARLHSGAIWQLHQRIEKLESALRSAGLEPETIG